MPGKAKHGKGKYSRYSKKSRSLQRQDTVARQMPAAAASPKAAPVPAARAAQAAALPVNAKVQYAHITGDLTRIGILTGIIAVILIILYFVLR